MMIDRVRSYAKACGGTSAIEFALLVPMMLLFMAGIVEIGRAYQMYSAVNRLATRYAIAWADCSDNPAGTCQTEMGYYTTAAAEQNMVPQLNPVSGIGLRMMQVNMSSTGTASVTYASPSGITPTAAELAVAQNAIANNQTGVVVTASYTYTPLFFASVMSPLLGSAKVFSYTIAQDKS